MSETIKEVLYTRIGETSEACVGTEDGSKTAVSTTKEGEIRILPRVLIGSNRCIVTTIGRSAFDGCTKLTNIIIPSTVTTIKYFALRNLYLKEPLFIPSSVTTVESHFIDLWYSKTLVFCGTKEPEKKAAGSAKYWISEVFTGSVVVPLNYENDKFCLKNIVKFMKGECTNVRMRTSCFNNRNRFRCSSFVLVFLICS